MQNPLQGEYKSNFPIVAERDAEHSASPSDRWGVVLAGGDGERLKPLVQMIFGDRRPKQFCSLFGGQTLLGSALRRAKQIIPAQKLLVPLNALHQGWYCREPELHADQRVVQPANRGTAPAIAYCLLSIADLSPDATVAILPSDHHYKDEPLFTAEMESAFAHAERYPDEVVLLGARPDAPEVGYGWIELGSHLPEPEVFRVKSFREKPCEEVARTLLRKDTAWNTFVMVGRIKAFLDMLRRSLPDVTGLMAKARLWKGAESYTGDSLYQQIPSTDFSRRVLAVETDHLLVMRLKEVGWNDLGDPERVVAMARASGREPWWARAWDSLRMTPKAEAASQASGKAPLSRISA